MTRHSLERIAHSSALRAALSRTLQRHALILFLCGTESCSTPKPAAPAVAPKQENNETRRIIDSLLGEMRHVEAATASQPRPAPRPALAEADSFDEDRERIRASLATWTEGTGAALRFVKQSTGERLSLIFVDETAPGYQSQTDMWMIQATARVSGGKVVGHFVLFLRDLKAGRYRGNDHQKEAVMGVLIGNTRWDGENPETAWSMNGESWCEVALQPPGKLGIEGEFKARLIDNKGSGYIQVESGYLFIKQ